VRARAPAGADGAVIRWRADSSAEPLAVPSQPEADAAMLHERPAEKKAKGEQTLTAEFMWVDGASERITVQPCDGDLPDACLQFPWNVRVHTRPDVAFYPEDQRPKVVRSLNSFPAASTCLFALEVRSSPLGAEVWAAGRYVQTLSRTGNLAGSIL